MGNLIGKRLKELRLSLGNSMEVEADKLNSAFNLKITKSMMSRWESGASQPTNIFLSAYAQFHNVDLNYLVGLTDIKKPLRDFPSEDYILNFEEKILIKKFRALDERGKKAVVDTLEREYKYVDCDQADDYDQVAEKKA